MAWQGAPPYYQDPNQVNYGHQPGYAPPQPGYAPPQPGYAPQQPGYAPSQPGYAPQQPGSYSQGTAGSFIPTAGFVQPPQDPRYGTTYHDTESGDDVKGFDFTDKSIRQAFIRKVYSILMVQLLITFGFVSLFTFHDGVKLWAYHNQFMVYIALGVMLVTMISMACCESVRRQSPMNFIFLGLFTLAEGFLLGVTAGRYKTDAVIMAVGITSVVCLALTIFALQTKWDFTAMGGVLLCILVVFVLFGFIAMFFKGKTITLVYSAIGALIFSLYLIYDTQMMVGGNHKYSISPEEYVFAALTLYLDIVNIFIYILTIIGASKDN